MQKQPWLLQNTAIHGEAGRCTLRRTCRLRSDNQENPEESSWATLALINPDFSGDSYVPNRNAAMADTPMKASKTQSGGKNESKVDVELFEKNLIGKW